MLIRETTLQDVPLLARFRALQLVDEGQPRNEQAIPLMEGFFTVEMRGGRVHGWLVEEDGAPVAVCSVSVVPFPPSFLYPDGRYGYLQSVYTLPEHRGRGHATALIEKAMNWCRWKGITQFFLYASEEGRRVYEKLGFVSDGHFMVKWDEE